MSLLSPDFSLLALHLLLVADTLFSGEVVVWTIVFLHFKCHILNILPHLCPLEITLQPKLTLNIWSPCFLSSSMCSDYKTLPPFRVSVLGLWVFQANILPTELHSLVYPFWHTQIAWLNVVFARILVCNLEKPSTLDPPASSSWTLFFCDVKFEHCSYLYVQVFICDVCGGLFFLFL